jgi:hypothetical protein
VSSPLSSKKFLEDEAVPAMTLALDNPLATFAQTNLPEIENFEDLLAEFEAKSGTKVGEIVRGRVVSVSKDFVTVDIGFKSEGQIPIEEFVNVDGSLTVKAGDSVEVYLESQENDHGQIELSKEKADTMKVWDEISAAAAADPRVQGIRHGAALGKSAALARGFAACRAPFVVMLDGDGQDDPAEIPRLLERLRSDRRVGLVNGWKHPRLDPWHKTMPSAVFNLLLGAVSGLSLHDHNCGLKAFRSGVAKALLLERDLHRGGDAEGVVAARGDHADELREGAHGLLRERDVAARGDRDGGGVAGERGRCGDGRTDRRPTRPPAERAPDPWSFRVSHSGPIASMARGKSRSGMGVLP